MEVEQSTVDTVTAEAPDTTPSWNGELESLEKESWYTSVPEDVRKVVRSGYETKLKNYDKGWQEKVRTLKAAPDDWSAKEQEWKTKFSEAERRAALYENLFSGQEDPRVASIEAEKAAWAEEKAALIAERDTYKSQAMSIQEAEASAAADEFIAEYADIVANAEAMEMFILIGGKDKRTDAKAVIATAAKAVRAAFDLSPVTKPVAETTPAPSEDEPEPMPEDLELASPGDSAHGTNANKDLDDEDIPWEVAVQRSIAKNSRMLHMR